MGITWGFEQLQHFIESTTVEGKENQHTRLCVLENRFDEFQNRIAKHMVSEDAAFKGLDNTLETNLSKILLKLEQTEQEHKKEMLDVVTQMRTVLDREYLTESELNNKLTELRKSIIVEIKEEKRSAYSDVAKIALGFTIALAISAWAYVNIFKDILHHTNGS